MQDFNNLPLEMVQNFTSQRTDRRRQQTMIMTFKGVSSAKSKYGVTLSQGDTIKVTVSKGRKEEKVLTAVQRVNIEYVLNMRHGRQPT